MSEATEVLCDCGHTRSKHSSESPPGCNVLTVGEGSCGCVKTWGQLQDERAEKTAAIEEGLRGAMTVGFAGDHLPEHALVVQLEHAASISRRRTAVEGAGIGNADDLFFRVDGRLIPISDAKFVPDPELDPLGVEKGPMVTLKLSESDSRIVVKALLRDANPTSVLPAALVQEIRDAHAVARDVREQLGSFARRSKLRDLLAAHAHEQWAGWMEYLFAKSTVGNVLPEVLPNATRAWTRNLREGVIIPGASYERWKRQVATAYEDLPDEEKESDLHQADKYIALLEDFGVSLGDDRVINAAFDSLSEELYGAKDEWQYPGQLLRSVRALMVLARSAVAHAEAEGCMFCERVGAAPHDEGCPLRNLPVTIQAAPPPKLIHSIVPAFASPDFWEAVAKEDDHALLAFFVEQGELTFVRSGFATGAVTDSQRAAKMVERLVEAGRLYRTEIYVGRHDGGREQRFAVAVAAKVDRYSEFGQQLELRKRGAPGVRFSDEPFWKAILDGNDYALIACLSQFDLLVPREFESVDCLTVRTLLRLVEEERLSVRRWEPVKSGGRGPTDAIWSTHDGWATEGGKS